MPGPITYSKVFGREAGLIQFPRNERPSARDCIQNDFRALLGQKLKRRICIWLSLTGESRFALALRLDDKK